MNIPRVTVIDEDGIEAWTGSLAVFLRENRDGIDPEWVTDALRECGRFHFGGGASPAFTVALI